MAGPPSLASLAEHPSSCASNASFPPLSRVAVDACAFPSWHQQFRRVTPKATVIPVEQDFIDYLKADGVFLPGASDDSDDSDANDSDSSGADDPGVSSADRKTQPDLASLTQKIQEIIDEYEAVFPKLNWTSPQDAAWMVATPNLRCTTTDDVYLALKASDFVLHDLHNAYDDCTDNSNSEDHSTQPQYCLVLKKWFAIPPSHEFRCFIRQNRLLGISQRDTNFYDFLQDPARQSKLVDLVERFFIETLANQLAIEDFVFDVYITRDEARVFLIDINPYAPRTDPLLFSWEEMHALANEQDSPVFRVIASEIQASQSMPRYSHNRYPKDVVGLSDGASIAAFAEQWRGALQEVGVPHGQASTTRRSNSPVGR